MGRIRAAALATIARAEPFHRGISRQQSRPWYHLNRAETTNAVTNSTYNYRVVALE